MERDGEISLLKAHELARQVVTERADPRWWQGANTTFAVCLTAEQAESVGRLRSATFTNEYRARLASDPEVAEGWALVPFEVDRLASALIAALKEAIDQLGENEPLGKSESAALSRRCLKIARFLVEQRLSQGGEVSELSDDILEKAADVDDEAKDAKSEPK